MKFKLNSVVLLTVFAFLLAGCGDSGKRVETTEVQDVTETPDDAVVLTVNTNSSIIEWLGKKVTGQHNGTVNISSGEVFLQDGKLTGGNFEVDMTTIKVLDIQDPETNAKLRNHLLSDDFFDVENHEKAVFEITSVAEQIDEKGNTHVISGNLTIKGISKNITFPATVNVGETAVSATADFDIDRTEWDVRYGSGRFFDNLGDNLINDNFNLKLTLTTE